VNDTPRYSSLRDYLRVLRSQRLLIVGVTLVFAAAAFLVSSLQEKEYTAETNLLFRDISSDLSLIGKTSIPELAPDQRAAINSDRVTRPDVVDEVRKSLKTDLTTAQLQDMISTQVGSRTNFVIIQASDGNPQFAARVANAFGKEVQKLDTTEVRDRIDNVIAGLRAEVRRAKKSSDPSAVVTLQVDQTQIAQLQTVRQLARPVEIARAAEPPGSPSSPRTTRNTLLGAIVGFAFGLLAAFLRDSLDRRLRNTDEVQAEMQFPVIGRVPDEALGHAGFANGSAGDLDVESHLEAFRMLRANLELLQAGSPMHSVMVTSGLPEEGKSTVALALAGAAAISGKRTLLVECDLRRPCLAERLGIEEEPGLSDYLLGQAVPADILQVVKLNAPAGPNGAKDGEGDDQELSRMVCITAGTPAELPAEMLGSERFSSFLAEVSKAYDLVVLDTSPILSVVDALELAPQVDGLLLCVRLSKTTRDEAKAAREALGHLPGRPTAVVVTGYRPGDESYYGYAYGGYSRSEK
jgi:Mrp family chromosome partitioning ATPase/capsular polysaccharide biosynthesis protein